MPKRTPIRGLGADAFFSSEEPGSQDKPVEQSDSKTVQQQNSKPANDDTLVKATFYLTRRHVALLEELKLKRFRAGQKVDKSELIREAIDLLAQQ